MAIVCFASSRTAALRELKAGHGDGRIERVQSRDIHLDLVRQVGGQAFHFHRIHRFHERTAERFYCRGLAREFERNARVHFLIHAHLMKIYVDGLHGEMMELHFLNQRLDRSGGVHLNVHQARRTGPREDLAKFGDRHRDGARLDAVTVDDRRDLLRCAYLRGLPAGLGPRDGGEIQESIF